MNDINISDSNKNNPVKIEVTAYGGYKGDERPISFIVNNQKIKVIEILERWIDPDKDFFKILAEDSRIYTISRERKSDEYRIERISEK